MVRYKGMTTQYDGHDCDYNHHGSQAVIQKQIKWWRVHWQSEHYGGVAAKDTKWEIITLNNYYDYNKGYCHL